MRFTRPVIPLLPGRARGMFRAGLGLVGLLALGGPLSAAEAPDPVATLFAQRVWPLLQEKCLGCHGKDEAKIKGGLDLRSRESLLQGGDSGESALVPGHPEKSPLWIAVTWKEEEFQMPPKENDRLDPDQIEWLHRWIAGGAPWPDAARRAELLDQKSWDEEQGVRVATAGGLSPEWTERRYDPDNLWAYQPLAKPELPDPASAAHLIDQFIGEALRSVDLQPAPRADRRTLVRRASYDLTGLPPSPAQVEDFLRDPAPDDEAFARLIERLLQSPHYGEQWGRHWLDVVRYADSSGLANDYERGNAWRYRDYVIRSFNEDKPFDQFVREQIAGDELRPEDPEMRIAVGFLRMGPWELTGMEVAKVARQRFLDDVTDSVGQVFLSHPLQCAKCHDHKFDPIPTRDYYRMQAVFATTQLAERKADFLPEENTNGFEEMTYLLERKKRYEKTLRRLREKEKVAAQRWCEERGLEYVPRQQALKRGLPGEQVVPRHIGLTPQDLGMERIARKGLERLAWELERYQPYALSVYNGRTPDLKSVYRPLRMPEDRMEKGTLEKTAILAGGDPFSPTQPVTPGVLSMLPHSSNRTHQVPDTPAGRRTALADWIASPQNPLTARSLVNRIWQWHFGRGLAANPNNFGATGAKPTHPRLLDWLAATFMEEGWSIKQLHRHIMMSEAYRRSSHHPDPSALEEMDPERQRYAAFVPRRLAAEELRDAMLAVSGELNRAIGGIPARPEINREAALQPRMVMGTYAPAWQPSPNPEQRHRRSVYVMKIRGLRDPFMEVFNQPSPDLSCERRDASSITPQVFSLFHGKASLGRALAFAQRLRQETSSPDQAVRRAFLLAYARPPTPMESDACLRHWQAMTARHRKLTFTASSPPGAVTREAVEENTGERFEFTEPLEFYQDFVPDLQMADADPVTRGLAEVCLVLMNANEFIYVY